MRYHNTSHIEVGSKNAIWFGLIFGGIGILGAIFGFVLLISGIEYQTSGIKTTGYVQNVEFAYRRDSDGDKVKKYTSTVSFQDKLGNTHKATFNQKLLENSSVPLLYLANNPSDAKIESAINNILGPIFLIIIGSGFAALGIWISLSSKKRQAEITWLNSRGQKISAQIIGIKEHISRHKSKHSFKSKYSYQVIARHEDYPNKFISESTPDEFDESYVGRSITVLVNPQNPESYFVDLESI